MKTVFATALFAATAMTPNLAAAQALPDAKIAVVDSDRIFGQCTACVAANTQLQAQRQQLQTLAQQLSAPLTTEAQSLQTAVAAAKGNPDAALQTRIRAFETRQQQAQQQVQTQEQTFQRNVAYVRQQIGERLGPVITQVATQRGATIAVDKNNTFYNAPGVEITDAVLAALNAALPSVSVTAPAQATAPAAPAATTPAPTRPATGR
ncbi:OmpH family outer membrane protein [uncultured Sphingomonas sp.]|uniref:OmpH family outer membrane protein n=1 Tax=uncultured Sphingomonas sp. TaxID=158754 RepID=UPI0025D46EFD|nr:OmpH family outer membrane protein [uncultured Sphingomonas sp.]